MRTTKFFGVAAGIAGMLLLNCNKNNTPDPGPAKPIVLTTKQSEKLSGDNTFAFNLFREVATSDDKENALISPLSVTIALAMLYNGTSPDARDEMATVLGMSDFSDTEINEYYQKMVQALLKIDRQTTLALANSIWSEKTFSVKQTFIDVNKKYYDAEVQSLNFSLQSTLDAINKWCAKKTNNKIPTILEEIPHDAVMYLINAVYFKSQWKFPFKQENTKKESFSVENGSGQLVEMMNQTETFLYYEDDRLQCLEMPYGNQAFSMVALLPAQSQTLDDLVDYVDNDVWNNILTNLWSCRVQVKFPRFKQECTFKLNDPIANLGMKLIFQTGGNLNGIAENPNLYVSRVLHKTFVEVNEKGTEAAAVTAIEMRKAMSPGSIKTPTFYADRPFIYLIKEKSTGAILFMGRMDRP
ncbi:MAG: serpin family protein [Bacteroidetes bacterium]|nr:serpin family protein [Bacteroidota bacterium]